MSDSLCQINERRVSYTCQMGSVSSSPWIEDFADGAAILVLREDANFDLERMRPRRGGQAARSGLDKGALRSFRAFGDLETVHGRNNLM